MKITRSGERLSDDSRPHELSTLLDELSVRAVMKEYLSQSGDSEWVNETKHDCRHQGEPHGNEEIVFHESLSDESEIRQQRIDELDSNEGSNDPAETINQQIAPKQRCRSHRPIPHASKGQRDQNDDNQCIEDYGR